MIMAIPRNKSHFGSNLINKSPVSEELRSPSTVYYDYSEGALTSPNLKAYSSLSITTKCSTHRKDFDTIERNVLRGEFASEPLTKYVFNCDIISPGLVEDLDYDDNNSDEGTLREIKSILKPEDQSRFTKTNLNSPSKSPKECKVTIVEEPKMVKRKFFFKRMKAKIGLN